MDNIEIRSEEFEGKTLYFIMSGENKIYVTLNEIFMAAKIPKDRENDYKNLIDMQIEMNELNLRMKKKTNV